MKLRHRIARWMLDGATIPSMRVVDLKAGEATVQLSGSRLTFGAYQAPTALGHLAVDQAGDGRAAVFSAGAANKIPVLTDLGKLLVGEINYHFSANFGIIGASTTAYISPTLFNTFSVSPLELSIGGTTPNPTKIQVVVEPRSNTVNPGTVVVTGDRNGLGTAASGSFVNGDTTAQQLSDTGSYAASDTFGLAISSTAAAGIFEATVTLRLFAPIP